jgi:hypothetical protein
VACLETLQDWFVHAAANDTSMLLTKPLCCELNLYLVCRLETLQDGFVQLRSIMRKDKQSRVESERSPLDD